LKGLASGKDFFVLLTFVSYGVISSQTSLIAIDSTPHQATEQSMVKIAVDTATQDVSRTSTFCGSLDANFQGFQGGNFVDVPHSSQNDTDKYDLLSVIGRGSFSRTLQVRDKTTGEVSIQLRLYWRFCRTTVYPTTIVVGYTVVRHNLQYNPLYIDLEVLISSLLFLIRAMTVINNNKKLREDVYKLLQQRHPYVCSVYDIFRKGEKVR
jgi:hypothetical protein